MSETKTPGTPTDLTIAFPAEILDSIGKCREVIETRYHDLHLTNEQVVIMLVTRGATQFLRNQTFESNAPMLSPAFNTPPTLPDPLPIDFLCLPIKKLPGVRLQSDVVESASSKGIDTVAELIQRSEEELLELDHFGPTTIMKIKHALAEHSLQLGTRFTRMQLEQIKAAMLKLQRPTT